MRRRGRANRYDYELGRTGAILMVVISLFMSIVFANVFFTNRHIERTDAYEKTAVFDCYEIQYGRRHSLNYLTLFFEDDKQQDIRGCCVQQSLTEKVKNLEKGTELHMIINPNNNYIIELRTDTKELLNFDYAQKMLRQEGVGFLYLAIFMLVLCSYFVYKAITTKERITKADIKFYWDIMKEK